MVSVFFLFAEPEYIDLTTKLAEKRIEKETPKKAKSSPKPAESAELSKKKQTKKKKAEAKVQQDSDDVSDEELDEEDEEDDLQVHNDDYAAEPAKPVTNDDFIQSLDADTLKHFNEFYTCCLTNNSQKLSDKISEFKSEHISIEKLLNKRVNKENGFTLLHLSSELGNHECIWQLLVNGADPSQPDLTRQNRVPYTIASNKQSRDQFRLFMNDYPDRYDYTKARVPGPLSREKLNEKTEKEKEKRKQQRKLKRERQAESKKIENEKDWEEKERQKFLALSDEQKRALTNPAPTPASEFMATSTFNTATATATAPKTKPALPKLRVANRCWFCAIDISELSQPFEYFDYKFCSARCLRAHRYLPKTGSSNNSK